jgi:hypothetical protein
MVKLVGVSGTAGPAAGYRQTSASTVPPRSDRRADLCRHASGCTQFATSARVIRFVPSRLNSRKREQRVSTVLGTRARSLRPNYAEFGGKTARLDPATIRCLVSWAVEIEIDKFLRKLARHLGRLSQLGAHDYVSLHTPIDRPDAAIAWPPHAAVPSAQASTVNDSGPLRHAGTWPDTFS